MNEIIDDFILQKKYLYNMFTEYFEKPIMTKIKDVNSYSMYISKVHCFLSTFNRYIIVLVEKDENIIGYTENLSNLQWVCIQTRELQDKYDLKPHFYVPKKQTQLNCTIIKHTDNDDGSVYSCDLPLEITLLHLNKKSDYYEFPHKGTLVAAIETYKTVITIL